MNVTGEYELNVEREAVWKALLDPDVLRIRQRLPGTRIPTLVLDEFYSTANPEDEGNFPSVCTVDEFRIGVIQYDRGAHTAGNGPALERVNGVIVARGSCSMLPSIRQENMSPTSLMSTASCGG